MQCVELLIPPLPQFITVGHAIWKPGSQHFERRFNVYDMLFVIRGAMYMSENERSYRIDSGNMLVLEPGQTHWGHRPCTEDTEVYWLHFIHPYRSRLVDSWDIYWNKLLPRTNEKDEQPAQQFMYVPKFGSFEVTPVVSIIEKMLPLHHSLAVGHSLPLHHLLAELFMELQAMTRKQQSSRSQIICDRVILYLHQHLQDPFQAEQMAADLHFHFDYLARCLKKHTGMTPVQYLQYIRIQRAKALLANTNESINAIAHKVGISQYHYFARVFKRIVGQTPSAYRAQHHVFSGEM